MSFKETLIAAKSGDARAKEEIYLMFRPVLIRKAMVEGVFDEDLFQELCIRLLICIERFDVERYSD